MPQISDRAIAELIYHLGRIVQGEGFVAGLTPAHWTALRYFTRANRFSRTVSAFADFHATTRGTASQTVKSLVTQGYLTRIRSTKDGRSASLDVTAKGHGALADDPFKSLVRAVGDVPPGGRRHLATSLERVLGQVASERGRRPFGSCPACQHLEGEGSGRLRQAPYACGLMAASLSEQELGEICVNFEPGNTSVMRRARRPGSPP
ncbi:MAG: MarR family winged helix-turn-helix transcriptional regulator [Geminicoccaceae bacterium]